jgi:hypothetical protein
MRHLMDRILTNDYLDKLLTELNQRLSKGTPALDGRIEALERRMAATDRAIRNLLDLAEVERRIGSCKRQVAGKGIREDADPDRVALAATTEGSWHTGHHQGRSVHWGV